MLEQILSEPNLIKLSVYAGLWFGLILFLFFVGRAIWSKTWPTVTGRVVRSKITEHKRMTGNHSTVTEYGVDFMYEYKVGGNLYSGKKVRFFDTRTTSRAFAEKIISTHPEGSSVAVSFNQNNPTRSVIYTGVSSGIWMFVIFFAVSIVSITATMIT